MGNKYHLLLGPSNLRPMLNGKTDNGGWDIAYLGVIIPIAFHLLQQLLRTSLNGLLRYRFAKNVDFDLFFVVLVSKENSILNFLAQKLLGPCLLNVFFISRIPCPLPGVI
jgi:hypothetical protein